MMTPAIDRVVNLILSSSVWHATDAPIQRNNGSIEINFKYKRLSREKR